MRKIFEAVQSIESKTTEWIHQLDIISIQLSDLKSELKNYLNHIELDPEKLQIIEERTSQIYALARKHKIIPQELVFLHQRLQTELSLLNACDNDILDFENQQKNIAAEYTAVAKLLTDSRKKASQKLEKEISATMRSLSLPYCEFKIDLGTYPANNHDFSIHGQEKIIFKIKTNPDQPLQIIAKAISGGELSRLSLSIHLALANRTCIPILIFDEVDTGVSGATAEKIGKLLQKLGQSYQVFCITHQPQVAACGQNHLLVEKNFDHQTTRTHLRLLNREEKMQEIARMLGGEKITEKTLEHAREVLQA